MKLKTTNQKIIQMPLSTSTLAGFIAGFWLLGVMASPLMADTKPANLVILCSPNLPKAERDELFLESQKFVVKAMSPGQRCQVFDGISLKPVADFTMPDQVKTDRARVRAAEGFIRSFGKFLSSDGNGDRQVRLPQFAGIFTQLTSASPSRLLVIGTPVYRDDLPANDMTGGWLGDGYLNQPRTVSLFSIADQPGFLKNAEVHFCTLSENVWATDQPGAQREGVQRFWTLFVAGMGGNLVSFQPSTNIALERLATGGFPPVGQFTLNSEEKELVIHRSKVNTGTKPRVEETVATARILDLSAPEFSWITKETSPIEEAPRLALPSPAPLPKSAPMQVALTWDSGGVDLDLYATGKPGGDELFYGHTETPEGVHCKDFTSPTPLFGFELIDFTTAVYPKAVTLWVNVHRGKSETGFPGKVRIRYGGSVFTHPFLIPAKSGNSGQDRTSRIDSPFWVAIPVAAVLGI